MRAGGWRLPILTVVLILVAAQPAGAADEGDIGIVDGSIRIVATATTPGESWGDDSGCTYEVSIVDDQAFGVYEADGTRLYSDTGRWLAKECNGQEVSVGGFAVFPEGGGFSTPDLLQQAIDVLDPPEPVWSASPNGSTVPMVVQLPTWFWVPSGYWGGNYSARVETPSGRVWAEARAVPSATVWTPGDGAVVACEGGGTPWVPGLDLSASDCAHVYQHSTAGRQGFGLSVAVTFDALGRTSTGGRQDLGQITRVSVPVLVSVGEIHAIETSGS